ncbi:MAG: serine/threonine-protein kinase PknK [Thermoanaerobaculia bacterium]
MSDPRLGTLLDRRYRILGRLGEGGAGVVYLARHEEMDRRVAIKVLSSELFPGPVAHERFRREARAAGALVHPHVVTVFDFGRTEADEPYLAMEHCDGGSLAERLAQSGRLAPREAVAILGGVAAAVDTAHREGVVHRDLKPGNILFAATVPKVADFGLARMLDADDPGLTGGHAIGSPYFMSPEQCQGQPAGPPSDLYSLGVIAYTMVAGVVPFPRGTAQEVLLAHLTESPRPLEELVPGIPERFARAVARALAKAPRERPGSAAELVEELGTALLDATAVSPMPQVAVAPAHVRRGPGSSGDRSTGAPAEPIARSGELAVLEAALRQAVAGDGQIVTLAGEPGAGKSTLAHAFLRRARALAPTLRLAIGRATEGSGRSEAYAPFLDAIGHLLGGGDRRELARELTALAPTWAAHFPGLVPSDESGGDPAEGRRSRDRMPREFATFLDFLTRGRPLVLLLEDLHWADAASIDLLLHLGPRLEGRSLLLVGTYRPGELEAERHPLRAALVSLERGGAPWSEILPRPFDEAAVAAFLERELGAAPPPELIGFAHRRTEGNPLFLAAVVAHLRETGTLERVGDQILLHRSLASMERIVPEGIAALLREKVERLEESDRRLLAAASVEGREFTAAFVARLVERDEADVEDELRALATVHRLVESIGETELPSGEVSLRFRFVHSLYQHAFYDGLAPRRRAALHLAAARELRALHAGRLDALQPALAHHFEEGRDFAGAIDALLAAAATAAWRNPKNARPLLVRALDLAARLPEPERPSRRADLLVRLGRLDAETAEFAGDVALYAAAERAVSEALTLEPGSIDARTVLGLIHLERGENERSFVDFTRALERESGHAPAWDGLSYLFKNTGLWSASLAAQQRAAALDARFASSIRRLSVLIYEKRLDEAVAYAASLVERRPRFAHYHYWRGIAFWYAGERAEARAAIEHAFALDPADPIAQGVLAFALAADGETTRARELLVPAESGAAADGTFTYWIAKVHALLGDPETALVWIARAADLGFWDARWIARDEAIRSLHGRADFAELVADLARRQESFRKFARQEATDEVSALLDA